LFKREREASKFHYDWRTASVIVLQALHIFPNKSGRCGIAHSLDIVEWHCLDALLARFGDAKRDFFVVPVAPNTSNDGNFGIVIMIERQFPHCHPFRTAKPDLGTIRNNTFPRG
jgi:hypothetical protein